MREIGNLPEARRCWAVAAERGVSGAMGDLGMDAFAHGDLDMARTWWLRGVDAGDDGSMFGMAKLADQLGDSNAADHWCKRAAALGNLAAINTLAFLAVNRGFHASAGEWWEQAVALGDASAAYNRGMLACLDDNEEDAEYWLWRATTHGDPDAWYMLNWMRAATGANRQNGTPDVPRPTAIWREAPDEAREIGIDVLVALLARDYGGDQGVPFDVLVDADLSLEQVDALAVQLILILSRTEGYDAALESAAAQLPAAAQRAVLLALECARAANVRAFAVQYANTDERDEGLTVLIGLLLQILKMGAVNGSPTQLMLETLRAPIERDSPRNADAHDTTQR
jgi:hypothetical protein